MSQNYEAVIGIEVHAQLKTKTKLFAPASTRFGQKPNHNVSPVCLGLPGALPILNKDAVRLAIIAGLVLNCRINERSIFARKNYFYPDLPKGYQISQYEHPICEHGHLTIRLHDTAKTIGITRIHMEEDAGKLVHQGSASIAGATHSHVDLNRAGCPLIEIVSEPDLRSAQDARAYVEALHTILLHNEVCDGNMQEGSLRADANISIRPIGSHTLGTRTEVKNLNSFRSLERAIQVEINRQIQLVESGANIIQETRHYDDATQLTSSLRSKEDAHDYRYFPDPDMPPLLLKKEDIEKIKSQLPEQPHQKKKRYQEQYLLSDIECKVLLADIAMDRFFRACVEQDNTLAKDCAKWIVGDVNAFLKEAKQSIDSSKLTPPLLIEMITLIQNATLSGKMAKELVIELIRTGQPIPTLIEAMGGGQLSDEATLQNIVHKILNANPDVVEKIKAGKTQSANFLMGQVMKETKGKARPDLVRRLILKLANAKPTA